MGIDERTRDIELCNIKKCHKKMKKNVIIGLISAVLFFPNGLEASEVFHSDSTQIQASIRKEIKHKKYAIDKNDYGDWRFRLGSYGEMLYQHFDYGPNSFYETGSTDDNRSQISIPRFVIAMDFKINPTWILSSEIEFEYGGTGTGIEYEYNEAGEYELEVEKGGEVAIEQFHITKIFNKALQLRMGHFVVPVGLTNAHHEPIFFFSTSRPEGESSIIPNTWHETGISLLGSVGNIFKYEVMCVNGLDPNFFSRANFIKNGKQSMFETQTMTNPALAYRLELQGEKSPRFGFSGYYTSKCSGNSSKPNKMEEIDIPVLVLSADAQYIGHNWCARTNFLWGKIGDSEALSKLNITMPKTGKISLFPRDQVPESALTWYAEVGYDLGTQLFKKCSLIPFVRYEYYNSMQTTEGAVAIEPRYKKDIFTAGINYYPLKNLVIKADFSHRWVDRGNYNDENTVSLSVGYLAWMFKHKHNNK